MNRAFPCFATILFTVCLSAAPPPGGAAGQGNPWLAKARATADSAKGARAVVLEGIYAKQTVEVAQAYERLLAEKPASEQRQAAFGYAVMTAGKYVPEHPAVVPMGRKAIPLLRSLVDPLAKIPPTERINYKLKPTKIPEAWLAWGIYLIGATFSHEEAGRAYKEALKLDPACAEAYYYRCDMLTYNPDIPKMKARIGNILRDLDRTEELNPKLHTLVTSLRGFTLLDIGELENGGKHLREYLRLWPDAPYADKIKGVISQVEKRTASPK